MWAAGVTCSRSGGAVGDLRVLPAPVVAPSENVVAILVDMLARAAAGEIVSVAGACECAPHVWETRGTVVTFDSLETGANYFTLIGALDSKHVELCDRMNT